jgi:hypothetical protein
VAKHLAYNALVLPSPIDQTYSRRSSQSANMQTIKAKFSVIGADVVRRNLSASVSGHDVDMDSSLFDRKSTRYFRRDDAFSFV